MIPEFLLRGSCRWRVLFREAGFEVRLAELAATGKDGMPAPAAFPQWLGETGPVVGFSSMSNMLPYSLEAARCLKAASPQTTIVFGGCGVQVAVKEILERFPFIDFIFQGEAEYTFPDFLRRRTDPAAWRQIPSSRLPEQWQHRDKSAAAAPQRSGRPASSSLRPG